MDLSHLQSTLRAGKWSITYSPAFVKQVSKGKKAAAAPTSSSTESTASTLPGKALTPEDPMLGFLLKLGEQRGWHSLKDMGVNVAHSAKSFRRPEPRFSSAVYPFRTTFGRYDLPSGECTWRVLERDTAHTQEANQHQLLEKPAPVLVTFFTKGLESSQCCTFKAIPNKNKV